MPKKTKIKINECVHNNVREWGMVNTNKSGNKRSGNNDDEVRKKRIQNSIVFVNFFNLLIQHLKPSNVLFCSSTVPTPVLTI